MRLTDLMVNVSMVATELPADPVISGLSGDSRAVKPGFLFAAFKGKRADGADFIEDALSRGAAAILTGSDGPTVRDVAVPVLIDPNPRRCYALLAAQFYRKQPKSIAAVTGTNGKSSVVSFLRQIWCLNGRSAASLGTLGLESAPISIPLTLTTPDPPVIHDQLARLATHGVNHLAIEASSHGLDQHRIDGVNVNMAGFTNLSRDHLDYHGSLAQYLSAKARLFGDVMAPGGGAVLNRDTHCYPRLMEICRERDHRVIQYGQGVRKDKGDIGNIDLIDVKATPDGLRLSVGYMGQTAVVEVSLLGKFQAENLLCAVGLAVADGVPFEAVIECVSSVVGVRGRMELVGRSHSGAGIYVDYAHTPDALQSALQALRFHISGRLHLVFGCGGERDRGKRSLMGRVAANLSDRVIVTDDNPRGEDAAIIRADILRDCRKAIEVGDRAAAIASSIAQLECGDALLIAGKGHETHQILGDHTVEFDDATVVRTAVGVQEL